VSLHPYKCSNLFTLKLYLIVFQDKVLGLTVKTESPQDYALVTFAAFSVYVELSSTGYKQSKLQRTFPSVRNNSRAPSLLMIRR
jgi:hypothetical protein